MFIYSFPILFTYIQFGEPREYLIAVLFLLIVLYIATPSNSYFNEIEWSKVSELTFYRYLFDSWNGHIKLWLVFWPFFIILNVSLFVTDTLAKTGHFTVSSWDEIHLIFFTPVVFWTICIWRNSINTSSRYWAVVARFMTLSVFFEYALKLVIRIDYPRIFFECQDLALDYSACF
ncbi:MAG: hypothetical protein L3J75_15720 [Methylococcaceae bacterium]|nr:hypothetical protein [Methylococcaceae bacterium]